MKDELAVSIMEHNGAPAIFINGKPQAFTHFKINENSKLDSTLESIKTEIPGIAGQGVNIYWIPTFIDWQGPGKYDFNDMDSRINAILKEYEQNTPAGWEPPVIIIRIQAAVFSPEWYIMEHMVNGQFTNLIEFKNPWGCAEPAPMTMEMRYATRNTAGYGSSFGISPGDKFWDTHALDCLKAIIGHVKAQPYHGRVIGYLPCALSTNEWFIHSDSPNSCCDFSKPMQEAFLAYIKGKNIATVENPVPTPREGFRDGSICLDPANPADRRLEEFSLFINHRVGDIIVNFAKIIKSCYAERNKLVGFFYGYTNELSPVYNLSQSGHLDTGRLLRCEYIDFFCSPCQYRYRADEMPFTYNQVLGAFADSTALYRKLSFAEDDHFPVGVFASTRDRWHDEMFFRRNFAQVATHGQHMWWYSLWTNWYREEYRQNIIGKLNRTGKQLMEMDRSSVTEVAVVVDERSISAMRLYPDLLKDIILDTYAGFFPAGTPFDYLELETFLDLADDKKYKFVFFLNLFRIDNVILEKLKRWKSNNRTLMFQCIPGFMHDSENTRTFSAANSSSLMEMEAEAAKFPLSWLVWIDPERTGIFKEDFRFGFMTDRAITPVLAAVDSEAENIGFLYDGSIGLARKKHKSWTSIFCAAPKVPSAVLRRLMLDAGVHFYAELGDVAYVNKSMVAYSSSSYGVKTLTLPQETVLTDVFTGETLSPDDRNQFLLKMKRHEVRIFFQ